MRITAAALLLCFAPFTAHADERAQLAADCATVDACIRALGATLPERNTGTSMADAAHVATVLKTRFGRSARDALLEKAVGNHGGWRNFSGTVLMHWDDWEEDDVPLLSRALSLQPGGWIARPLAQIGSPAAIDALIEDFIAGGGSNQTSYALETIGPEILPRLLPVLELPGTGPRTGSWRHATTLIGKFGADAAFVAGDWAAIAVDSAHPLPQRIAALRGLAAIGEHAAAHWSDVQGLRTGDDPEISTRAFDTLVAMHDPAIAEEFALSCAVTGESLDPFAGHEFRTCLFQLAGFGQNGRAAGPHLLRLLDEPSIAIDQARLIEALGSVDYRPAGDIIATFLTAQDWRVVYAAVRALGKLKAYSAREDLRDIESLHWLPEVRELAQIVGHSLDTGAPFDEPAHIQQYTGRRNFGNYELRASDGTDCPAQTWKWHDRNVSFRDVPDVIADVSRLELEDGAFFGTSRGEFGGSLEWRPARGDPAIVLNDNVVALLDAGPDVIAVFGLGHLGISRGYAVRLERDGDSGWAPQEIARFPSAVWSVVNIGQGEFAAYANGRIVVFSSAGIEGLAVCVETDR